jgi:hypothetical protein
VENMSEIKQNESKRSDGFIGSIYFASGILPWEDDFPLVDAYDVAVEGGKRLSDVLKDIETGGGNAGGNAGGSNVNVDASLSIPGDAADAAEVGRRLDAIDKAVIEDTTDGSGYVRNIQTFDGDRIVRLFIGTEKKYETLLPEEKDDLLAIITDNVENEEQVPEEKEQKVFSVAYEQEIVKGSRIIFGMLPEGKTIDDIMGISLEMYFSNKNNATLKPDDNICLTGSRTSIARYSEIYRAEYVEHHFSGIRRTLSSPCVMYMNVHCEQQTDGSLYLNFLDGFFTVLDGNSSNNDLKTENPDGNNNSFILRNVTYWLA